MASLAPTRSWKDIYFVTIHHDAVSRAQNMKELKQRARSYDNYHKKKGYVYTKGELGYRYISYHYLIAKDGSVLQVQPDRYVRWHAGDNFRGKNSHNLHGIAICLSGNFQKVKPTQAQLEATAELIADLEMEHDKNFTVRGHRDTAHPDYATACPGVNLANKIRWIIERVNYIKENPNAGKKDCEKELRKIKQLESEVKDKKARIKLLGEKADRLEARIEDRDKKIGKCTNRQVELENDLSKIRRELGNCNRLKKDLRSELDEQIKLCEVSLDEVQKEANKTINNLEQKLKRCMENNLECDIMDFEAGELIGGLILKLKRLFKK